MPKLVLTEETLQPEFVVWASNKVSNYIDWVLNFNKNNLNAIRGFYDAFKELHHHLSYRSVGLSYGNPNPFSEFGLSVHYNLKHDVNGQPYINIYRIRIDFEYFGLANPSNMSESRKKVKKLRLTESEFHTLISECVKKILKQVI